MMQSFPPLLFLLLSFCHSSSITLFTSSKMSPFINSPEWPVQLQENIKKVSLKPFCLEDDKCRAYS
jgi:hypothetical protein